MSETQVVVLSDSIPQVTPLKPAVHVFSELLDCRSMGNNWLRTYEIPGKKALLEILAKVYSLYLVAESMNDDDRTKLTRSMRGNLKDRGINLHTDTPLASVMLRMVFPNLEKSRVSRYASVLQAVQSHRKSAANFVAFVNDSGGIAKVAHAAVTVVVPGKPAKPEIPPKIVQVIPEVGPSIDEEISDEESEDLEYGDELYAYMECRRAAPLASVLNPGISAPQSTKVLLVVEIVGNQLQIIEQAPYVEDAVKRAFRDRFATPDLLRKATNPDLAP